MHMLSKLNSNNKRVSIALIDIFLAVVLTFHQRLTSIHLGIFLGLFCLLLVFRIFFDCRVITVEETFYQQKLDMDYLAQESVKSRYNAMAEQSLRALKAGDIKKYKEFNQLKMELSR